MQKKSVKLECMLNTFCVVAIYHLLICNYAQFSCVFIYLCVLCLVVLLFIFVVIIDVFLVSLKSSHILLTLLTFLKAHTHRKTTYMNNNTPKK